MLKPRFLDGIIIYILSVLILFTIGGYVQNNFGLIGLALSQIFLVTPPILYSYVKKLDFKTTFKLNKPKIKYLFGGLFLWLGGYFYIIIITNILIMIFPNSLESLEALNEALIFEDSFILNLIVVALFPAFCEEFIFRGFIMSSFDKCEKSSILSVIISSALFGILHIYFIKIIPTALLGFIIGYSVYKTNSIFVGSFIHFINNALSVVMMFLVDKINTSYNSEFLSEVSTTQSVSIVDNSMMFFVMIFIISTLFIFLGNFLLSDKSNNQEINN